MTRDEIMKLENHRLDELVAVFVMKARLFAFSPSTRISDAWEVHQKICGLLFSKRKRYFDELQKMVSAEYTENGKTIIAYPDVFIFVKPSNFCRAALLAVMEIE